MTKAPKVVVAANPDFFLIAVHPQGGSERPIVSKAPIVAWRIDADSEQGDRDVIAEPICCDTTAKDLRSAILYPDGRVVELFAGEWETVEAFVAERMKDAAKAKR